MTEKTSAADINDVAWDPQRDSELERRSLLAELDPLPSERFADTFRPEARTRHGQPLGERARLLLLGATTEDLEVMANEVNLAAGVDDDDEAAALRSTIDAYEDLLGRYRVLARDSDERTMARMPVAERRLARELANRIAALQAARYDGVLRGRRWVEGLILRYQRLLAGAEDAGDGQRAAEIRLRLEQLRQDLVQRTPGRVETTHTLDEGNQ